MRGVVAGVKQVLWIAITPLALTVLFSSVGRAQTHDGHGEAHGSDAVPAEHHGAAAGEHGAAAEHHGAPKNPITNFANFSWSGKDSHGGKFEPEQGDHKMPAPFSMALLNFGVLVALIGKYAAPAFKKMVRDRHDLVAKQLAESARLRADANAKLTEYTQKVASLDAEIAKLVEGIRAEADADKARIVREAEDRAGRMQKEAEQQIAAEITRVRLQLEREATETAMTIARRILTEKTSEADQRALSEKFIKELGGQSRTTT